MAQLSRSLFELAQVLQQIEENDGEISDDLLPILSKNEAAVLEKVDSYVYFYDNLKAQIEKKKKLIEKFRENLQTLERLEYRLKFNVKHLMQLHDLIQIDGHERSIKLLSAGGVQSMQKPEDLYVTEKTINPKYLLELEGLVEQKTVYVIKDEEFKHAVKENKLEHFYMMPREKYVKFS